ncbi:signal peptidase I [Nakamurella sp. A5-74]|uniref:Signal peptidase I n=1 Tax=Nakamurella sp. A5-74 TaxID=3158264 RepID=A0AAU8DLC1_9ACTN
MNEPQPARVGHDDQLADTPVSPDDRTDTDAGGAVSDTATPSVTPDGDPAATDTTAVGATTASDTTASDTTASDTTTSDTTASETAASETAGSDTAASDTTGPDGGTAASPDADEHTAAVAKWRARNSKRRKPAKKRPWWVEVPLLLVTAFLLTFLIQTFLFKVYYVPSGSMEPTLHGVTVGGDRILANKVVYDFRDPKPGDIVVFRGPDTWAAETNAIPGPTSVIGKIGQALGSVVGIAPPNEKDFVKRVIAVGGQTVECCDAQGRVMVDGVPLDEPYVVAENKLLFEPGVEDCTTSTVSQRCFLPYKVPEGQIWVMGDNRAGSGDSSLYCQRNLATSMCQGPIPVGNVIGKAIFVIMPVSRWHTLGDPGTDHRAG